MLKPASYTGEERIVKIDVGPVSLEGNLLVPENNYGMVIFLHESGSNRFNPTNRFIAKHLHNAGLGSLLFDLLDPHEAEIDKISRHMRFDIDLITERAEAVAEWVLQQPQLQGLRIGFFGCGRGAAAALTAASRLPKVFHAMVSHGGRLDLATTALSDMQTPTLLIVGRIKSLLNINQQAFQELPPSLEKKIEIFKQVSYFWDDPETLRQLSLVTEVWFRHYLGQDTRGRLPQQASGPTSI